VEEEYAPLYRDIGLGLTTWSPLASGLLTGKYRNGIPQGSRGSIPRMSWLVDTLTDKSKNAAVNSLETIARELDCTLAQLALAWCLKNPNVSCVITGASRASQVEENLRAVDVAPKLTPEMMKKIDALTSVIPA
jgi:aryl-alcohol dehydrogenase-like predicted oxidoreductase